ncbi:MAG TPA: phosphoribosylaminoimidazolesuccinocarboxamide synthase [Clostridia bacterium]|jgi:phosphoribosylaminoimidazole-succinocarboxamide synthase|nr:phosphoribosylaminoimidazolesuccinocarboxamide synthase [Clostridia bacterium]
MVKKNQLYEGKAKKIYATDDSDVYWVEYKDDATAFNGQKRGSIIGKGEVNNQLSALLFEYLENNNIPTHFLELVNEREMLVKSVKIIPIEVVVRNIVAGGMASRLGLEEGTVLKTPVIEYYYKSDEFGDPMINDDHIRELNLATPEQLQEIKNLALKIDQLLQKIFDEKGFILVDFKLEFGVHKGQVILADEISPDTARIWDKQSKEKMDKDRFRQDLGGVEAAYQEVLRRFKGGRAVS